MEEHNLRVFILCTHSVAGSLPLGLIVTSDETTSTLVAAFEAYRDSLPPDSFFNRGNKVGPEIFLTDNCSEERDALSIVWPTALLILCVFHVLQQVWRWLHDKNHRINLIDRPTLLSKFKGLVYAKTNALFEEYYEELSSAEIIIERYPNFGKYLDTLYEYKESWALCFRNEISTRGNNTNNYAESQFLIMKELLLQRIKEYNINALFEKLIHELNEYYKNKLLSVASGSFDGFYSKRYMGKQKKAGETGFAKPTADDFKIMEKSVIQHGNDVFTVQSTSQPHQAYLVDMSIGTCECVVGKTGAPCKHQYVLWVCHKASNPNFLPIFDKFQRKRFAEIAIGTSLPLEFYEGLHSDTTLNLEPDINEEISLELLTDDPTDITTPKARNVCFHVLPEESESKSIDALEKSFDIIRGKVKGGDKSLHTGIEKFSKRLENMTTGQLTSALHEFGSQRFETIKDSSTKKSFARRGQKFKIGVQPEAVKRRVNKNGTKKSLKKGKSSKFTSSCLPTKLPSRKRKHQFVTNVTSNQPVAKKAGRSMVSKTKNILTGGKRPQTKIEK